MTSSDQARETRADLAQLAWVVLLIDGIALGLGLLAGQYVRGAHWLGVVLAGWVTLAFAILAAGNLAAVWLARGWRRFDARRQGRARPSA